MALTVLCQDSHTDPSFRSGATIVRIDSCDPAQRKSTNPEADALFVVDILNNPLERFVNIEMESGWSADIQVHPESWGGDGIISISFDSALADFVRLEKIVLWVAECLNCFTVSGDWRQNYAKRKAKLMRGIDIRRELPWLSWITYYGAVMVKHFGRETLLKIGAREVGRGMIFRLADDAGRATIAKAMQIQKMLGSESFAKRDNKIAKAIGEFVPSFEQIRAGSDNE